MRREISENDVEKTVCIDLTAAVMRSDLAAAGATQRAPVRLMSCIGPKCFAFIAVGERMFTCGRNNSG